MRAQGWRLDYTHFKSYLQSQLKVTKAYLFIGYIEEQQEMYKQLRQMGYSLVFKPTVIHGDEVKGNVDVELVLQVMADWNRYRKAVIISGDGDFFSLVKYLIEKDKLASLIIPNQRKYSSLFNELPKKYLRFMDGLRDEFSYKPNKSKAAAQAKPTTKPAAKIRSRPKPEPRTPPQTLI